jgi:hypothetical protein
VARSRLHTGPITQLSFHKYLPYLCTFSVVDRKCFILDSRPRGLFCFRAFACVTVPAPSANFILDQWGKRIEDIIAIAPENKPEEQQQRGKGASKAGKGGGIRSKLGRGGTKAKLLEEKEVATTQVTHTSICAHVHMCVCVLALLLPGGSRDK